MINVRNKGQTGEREVVRLLNGVIEKLLAQQCWTEDVVNAATKCIQRNQQQSAVGGADLTGVFGLAIEIKRQENVQIDKWWAQCTEQAARNNEVPVLLYRQNHQPWRCVMLGLAVLPGERSSSLRMEIEQGPFMTWFYQWVYYKMIAGDIPRV